MLLMTKSAAIAHKAHRAISVRLDNDLEPNVTKWLSKNPGIHLSRLVNLAVRRFITEPQILEPVTLETAKIGKVKQSMKKMMSQHQNMLDKLK